MIVLHEPHYAMLYIRNCTQVNIFPYTEIRQKILYSEAVHIVSLSTGVEFRGEGSGAGE